VTHLARVRCNFSKHWENLPMFVTKLGYYPIVLGIPWLKHHDVDIYWSKNTVAFNSDHCLQHCLDTATSVKGITMDSMRGSSANICQVSAASFKFLAKRPH